MLHAVCTKEYICPLFQSGYCSIIVPSCRVAVNRQKLCCSDDYDNCTRYLGFLLRRTRPLRGDNDWLDVK